LRNSLCPARDLPSLDETPTHHFLFLDERALPGSLHELPSEVEGREAEVIPQKQILPPFA